MLLIGGLGLAVAFGILAGFSLRGARWAYTLFVVLGLLFFPARVGFHLSPQACEFALDVPLALFSLTNYSHIILLGLFFAMTSAQMRPTKIGLVWACVGTLAMGILVEIAEGVTGNGHCRVRDLVPDAAGAVLGAAVVSVWRRWRTNVARSTAQGTAACSPTIG